MGFGSYDESEQNNGSQNTDVNDDEAVKAQENSHDGEISFESDASQDELLDRLQDMKDDE